jgi:cell wall-associated NlpC family hydrolase
VNTAEYVDRTIAEIKASGGIPLSEAAWQAALLCVGWPYIFGARGQLCTPSYRRQVYNRNPSKEEYQNVRKACQAIRENNPTGSCSGCKWFPGGKRVRGFDCRGFTYWVLLQIYGWELQGAGCTSQWNNAANWKAKGEVADGIPQNVIVCLFYWKKDKNGKRTTTVAHTGLYFNGQTCECSSGVQHSKTLNKKWEMWGVPACVDVVPPTPTPTPPGPEPEKKPTIRRGDRGPYVKLCQEDLMALGYSVGSSGADGIFGKNTEAGVKAFQKDHDDRDGRALKVDGIVGEKTWGALDDAIGKIGT